MCSLYLFFFSFFTTPLLDYTKSSQQERCYSFTPSFTPVHPTQCSSTLSQYTYRDHRPQTPLPQTSVLSSQCFHLTNSTYTTGHKILLHETPYLSTTHHILHNTLPHQIFTKTTPFHTIFLKPNSHRTALSHRHIHHTRTSHIFIRRQRLISLISYLITLISHCMHT